MEEGKEKMQVRNCDAGFLLLI